jgi:hypothetical protein
VRAIGAVPMSSNSPQAIDEPDAFETFDRLPLPIRRALNRAWFNWSPACIAGLLAQFTVAQIVAELPDIDRRHAAKSR